MYLFLAVLGLHCCAGFIPVAGRGSPLQLRCARCSLRWLLVAEHGSGALGFSSQGTWARQSRPLGSGAQAQQFWCRRLRGLPWWLRGKESACSAGFVGLISGLGRSPGEGNGDPLQYSCLENPMDRGT